MTGDETIPDLARVGVSDTKALPSFSAMKRFRRALLLLVLLVGGSSIATSAERLPVPTAAELKSAQTEIKDLFKGDLAAAKSAGQLTELAEKILGNVQNEETTRVADYVLLTHAQSVAVKASNIALTRRIVRLLSEKYDVDEQQLAAAALKELGKGPVDANYHRELAELALQLASEAQAAGRLDVISGYLETVSSVATKLKSTDLAKKAAAGRSDLTELKKLSEKLPDALKTLTTKEQDSAANGIVGRHALLAQQDWMKALPHLAFGDDAAIKIAAEADLAAISAAEPIAADEAVVIAAHWWDISAKQTVPGLKTAFKHRASQWYDFALPNLKALAKTKVVQRLAESDWKREFVVATKAPLNINVDSLKAEIDAAHGLLHQNYAICQAAKFDSALTLSKKLEARQFRLTRFRPYVTDKGLQVSAIWVKDGAESEVFIGTLDEVSKHFEENRKLGFVPVDVAGFVSPNESAPKLALVSAKLQLPKGSERKLILDYVSNGEVAYLKEIKQLPLTFQRYLHPDGKLRSALVVCNPDGRFYTLRAGPLDWCLAQMKGMTSLAEDAGVVINGETVVFVNCFLNDKTQSPKAITQHVGHSHDLAENLDAWRKLAADGAYPVALAVGMTANGTYHTMWVWQQKN